MPSFIWKNAKMVRFIDTELVSNDSHGPNFEWIHYDLI